MNTSSYLQGYLTKSSADMASLPAPGNNLIRDPVDDRKDNKQTLKEKLKMFIMTDKGSVVKALSSLIGIKQE